MRNLQCSISYVEKYISADFCICITVPLTLRINISLKRPKSFYSDLYSFYGTLIAWRSLLLFQWNSCSVNVHCFRKCIIVPNAVIISKTLSSFQYKNWTMWLCDKRKKIHSNLWLHFLFNRSSFMFAAFTGETRLPRSAKTT